MIIRDNGLTMEPGDTFDMSRLGEFRGLAGMITRSLIAAGTDVEATKVEHRVLLSTDFGLAHNEGVTGDVYKTLYRAPEPNTLVNVSAALFEIGAATMDIKFDLFKVTAATQTLTSVLSGTIDFTDADADNTIKVGTLASTALATGDLLIGYLDWTSDNGAQGPLLLAEVQRRSVA